MDNQQDGMMKKYLFVLLVLLLIPTTVYSAEGLRKGRYAPNLIGRTIDGEIFRLSAVKSNIKVLNFWWIKCIPCKAEMPELAEMEKRHPQVKFIAVHTVKVSDKKIKAFLKSVPASISLVVKGNRKMLDIYHFKSLPHTLVLDKKNRVLGTISGYTKNNMKKLEAIIDGA